MDSSANLASRSARREAARQARDAFPPMGIYAIRDRASGMALVPALLSMAVIVGIELPVAVALEARFGLAGVFWACPAAFLAMLVLHGLYYRHKEKKDGSFPQPGVALGAAGGRAPGA
ncbi:MAG: Na+ driven multidrug efflux pump [Burkholderia sp.]|nr:Na+ driven multidrug efflux pump [Burkholderia sp.]